MTKCLVSAVSGQCRDTISACRMISSNVVSAAPSSDACSGVTIGSYARTVVSNPESRLATVRPIAPNPSRPMTLPCNEIPERRGQPPERVALAALGMLPRQRQHQTDCKFSYRPGVRPGCVGDDNPFLPGSLQVDRIYSNTVASDDLQAAGQHQGIMVDLVQTGDIPIHPGQQACQGVGIEWFPAVVVDYFPNCVFEGETHRWIAI